MPRCILIIEDEPTIAAALRIRLQANGFDPVVAQDGLSGLAAAKRDRPDAILLDVRLPDTNGYELCRRLKADPALAAIPVMILTANAKDESRRSAWQAGAAAYLSKPFDSDRLVRTLADLTDPRRQTEQAA